MTVFWAVVKSIVWRAVNYLGKTSNCSHPIQFHNTHLIVTAFVSLVHVVRSAVHVHYPFDLRPPNLSFQERSSQPQAHTYKLNSKLPMTLLFVRLPLPKLANLFRYSVIEFEEVVSCALPSLLFVKTSITRKFTAIPWIIINVIVHS